MFRRARHAVVGLLAGLVLLGGIAGAGRAYHVAGDGQPLPPPIQLYV